MPRFGALLLREWNADTAKNSGATRHVAPPFLAVVFCGSDEIHDHGGAGEG